ncbi:MAG: hypothetical protein F7C35_08895 [Desulfurococcales archaeon]|nr:hypothetical protein [Desulfurococcales archaeon]
MVTPLYDYVNTVLGSYEFYGDFYWPFTGSQNPYQDLIARGSGVIIVQVLSVEKVYRHNFYAYVVYESRVDKVLTPPGNAQNSSMIEENKTIEIIVPAFLTKEAVNKTNLTIEDVATPFPLLEPGYEYIVFVDVRVDGVHVHYDYVWGPWAYLVVEGKVYSLDNMEPPDNVNLDPTILFTSPNVKWEPYPYPQLRSIAVQKLSVNGEPLDAFVSRMT